MALCGSDSVLSDYSLVHKNGTYPLFLSMKYNGKNTYSITMSIKFELEYNIGSYPEFRQHETSELTDRHVKVSNRYYDITPGSLITAYATDGGLISPGL